MRGGSALTIPVRRRDASRGGRFTQSTRRTAESAQKAPPCTVLLAIQRQRRNADHPLDFTDTAGLLRVGSDLSPGPAKTLMAWMERGRAPVHGTRPGEQSS